MSLQVMDEARHVEAFQRYLEKADRVYPMTPTLRWLMRDILKTRSLVEKLLGMNLMVEGLALSGFQAFVKATRDPLATQMLTLILKDESRHVGFGVQYLPHVFRGVGALGRIRMLPRQLKWMWLIYESILAHRKDAESFGFDVAGVVEELLTEHQKRIQQMGLRFILDPRPLLRIIN